jgi:hypothetical protein
MCEFVVYMEEKDGTRREVTRNIVVAKRREGKTLLDGCHRIGHHRGEIRR